MSETTRRLKAAWTHEAEQDLMDWHGISAENVREIMAGMMMDEFNAEIDQQTLWRARFDAEFPPVQQGDQLYVSLTLTYSNDRYVPQRREQANTNWKEEGF